MSQEIFDRMRGAKAVQARASRIDVGRHVLILKSYGLRKTSERGTILAADFVVEESVSHKPGEIVGQAWFVNDASWKGEKELGRAQAFAQALLGLSTSEEGARAAQALAGDDQPGTGIRVVCYGVKGKRDFVEAQWEHFAQSPEMIKAARSKFAAEAPAAAPAAVTPPPAVTGGLGALLGK